MARSTPPSIVIRRITELLVVGVAVPGTAGKVTTRYTDFKIEMAAKYLDIKGMTQLKVGRILERPP